MRRSMFGFLSVALFERMNEGVEVHVCDEEEAELQYLMGSLEGSVLGVI